MANSTSSTIASEDTRPFLLRVREVESLYAIPRSSLYEIIGRGELSVVHLGRSVRIVRQELEDYLRSRSRRIG